MAPGSDPVPDRLTTPTLCQRGAGCPVALFYQQRFLGSTLTVWPVLGLRDFAVALVVRSTVLGADLISELILADASR